MGINEIEASIAVSATGSGPFAIAYAILQLAHAQQSVAAAIRMLGTTNAGSPMGAVEFLASEVGKIAASIDGLADQIWERDNGE